MVSSEAPLRWSASRDGVAVGQLHALLRPDTRCYLLFLRDCAPQAYGPLLDAALDAVDRDLYVDVDETAGDLRRELAGRGFAVNRREDYYLVPTDPTVTGLAGWPMPDGFQIISAAEADVDRLRDLDDTLRQDVPGTAGWRNDPAEFAGQTFGDPEYDPATYLLAVDTATDGYAGLVRVWVAPGRPRLGLVGTVPAHRRRGLATALLARAFAVLHARGQPAVTCEVDRTNTASTALLTGLGARRTGGGVELVRRHPPS